MAGNPKYATELLLSNVQLHPCGIQVIMGLVYRNENCAHPTLSGIGARSAVQEIDA
jgi:hypothetical protein